MYFTKLNEYNSNPDPLLIDGLLLVSQALEPLSGQTVLQGFQFRRCQMRCCLN